MVFKGSYLGMQLFKCLFLFVLIN